MTEDRERADTAIELTQAIMQACGITTYSLDKKQIKGIWARFAVRVERAARCEERTRLKEELVALGQLARWDGPDAAPNRMHEIWVKLSRLIENDEWLASLEKED